MNILPLAHFHCCFEARFVLLFPPIVCYNPLDFPFSVTHLNCVKERYRPLAPLLISRYMPNPHEQLLSATCSALSNVSSECSYHNVICL
jgi:hypothetical protein